RAGRISFTLLSDRLRFRAASSLSAWMGVRGVERRLKVQCSVNNFVGQSQRKSHRSEKFFEAMEYKMRHYLAVKIPRMTTHELEDIIDRRKNIFNIRFLPKVTTELARIASGYPSVAHTLALNSCFAWLSSNAGKLVRN